MSTDQSRALLQYSPALRYASINVTNRHELNGKLDRTLGDLTSSSPTSIKSLLVALDSIKPGTPHSSLSSASDTSVSSAVLVKTAFNALSITMDRVLDEALQAERDIEWWRNIESSRLSTAYFLLQIFPIRLARLAREIVAIVRINKIQLSLSNLNRETFRLRIAPHLQVFSTLFPAFTTTRTLAMHYEPLELARNECVAHRKELIRARDARAQELGQLTFLSSTLLRAVAEIEGASPPSSPGDPDKQAIIAQFVVSRMEGIISAENAPRSLFKHVDASNSLHISTAASLQTYLRFHLSSHCSRHASILKKHQRPGRWTLAWPRAVLYPPIIILGLRAAYQNRDSFVANMRDIAETVRAFWVQWVVEPIGDILRTVRTGGDDSGRVISKEGLSSDMASLERMVVSLATEKQNWLDSDLRLLSEKIRQGDLTPVLQIYESDIKTPVRSAVSGTLIRSLLIQVQKAKVDIDLALAGIDKLLRSQELTFGFVGVAPALAVLYVSVGWVRRLIWPGQPGSKGHFGGKQKRSASFYSIRRIERLLTQAEASEASESSETEIASSFFADTIHLAHAQTTPSKSQLDAKTHGLLILSLTHLRRYAESSLPKQSCVREGILDDLADLENPLLRKEDKLRVVERMWRSWSNVLGWGTTAFI